MERETKTELKTENSETSKTSEIKPICQKNCRVCNSGHIEEIHSLRDSKTHYRKIIEIFKKKYNYELSPAGLSRHFANYRNRRVLLAAEIMDKQIVEESTEVARHTTQIISLIDKALICIEAGTVKFDVSDLEKLFKIRHQILAGDAGGEDSLVAVFQNAIDKYGVNVNQGILFKPPKSKLPE